MINALSYYCLGRLMQQFQSHILVNHAFGLRDMCDLAKGPAFIVLNAQPGQPIHVPDVGQETVPEEIRGSLRTNVKAIEAEAIKVQLRGSYDAIQLILQSLDQSYYPKSELARDATDLHGRLVSDLRYTTCFALWGKTEELYRAQTLFGELVATQFPSAATDIVEAGKCLAFDRATACVFHLMRVMEVGLRVLAGSLNDPRLDPKINPTWHNILKKGDEELQKPVAQRTPEWAAHDQFFSEAQAYLRAVQFAWRNPTMHVDIHYDPEKAGDVMQAVKAFMRHLASVLSE